jgi:hypothetical protein
VTRIGINQFWYNHWYSSNNYSTNLSQDELTIKLLSYYIKHGASYPSNIFIHEYWYKKTKNKVKISPRQNLMQFFKRQYYSNSTLSIEHSYLIRYTTGEYFPTRLWLLRYNNWLVLSVSWYKPNKTKNSYTSNTYKQETKLPYLTSNHQLSLGKRKNLAFARYFNQKLNKKTLYSF